MFDLPSRWRTLLIAAIALATTAPSCFGPRIPQDPAYHNFADGRAWLGIPNFGNVVSNGLFVAVGLYGLVAAIRQFCPATGGHPAAAIRPAAFRPYIVFFIGVTLTCVGSAYYHWSPSNERLVWDRLPMSLGFMGLLAATTCERVSERLGRILLTPLVLVGLFSVLFWSWTESAGRGDLRPYYAVQFVSLLLVLVMVLLFTSPQGGSVALLASVALYAAAKVCEVKDRPLLDAIGISGHTLKHMLAALSIFLIAQMLARRARRFPAAILADGTL
jgi:hypothetical protein